MSALKDGRVSIELDKTRHLSFSLNVLDELNDKYGGIDKIGDILTPENPKYFKDLKWILALLVNEGADEGEPELTEKQVGKMINMSNITYAMNAVAAAINTGEVGEAQPDEVDEENPKIAATMNTI